MKALNFENTFMSCWTLAIDKRLHCKLEIKCLKHNLNNLEKKVTLGIHV